MRIRSQRALLRGSALVLLAWLACGAETLSARALASSRAHVSTQHYACTGPSSASVPCHFSTPSGNIRCLWTPKPNRVACVLRSSGRAYRLAHTGKAKRVTLKLTQPGETLPTNQNVTFPQALSCHDTKTTMTCNQDFLTGAFTLAPTGSHSS